MSSPAVDLAGMGASFGARIFVLVCGLVLSAWAVRKLSRRELLIPVCSLVLLIALGLIAFAALPNTFDKLSYAVGIKYPPLLYLVITIVLLMVIVLDLAKRLSVLDFKCRRLAQELALLRFESKEHHDAQISRPDQSLPDPVQSGTLAELEQERA